MCSVLYAVDKALLDCQCDGDGPVERVSVDGRGMWRCAFNGDRSDLFAALGLGSADVVYVDGVDTMIPHTTRMVYKEAGEREVRAAVRVLGVGGVTQLVGVLSTQAASYILWRYEGTSVGLLPPEYIGGSANERGFWRRWFGNPNTIDAFIRFVDETVRGLWQVGVMQNDWKLRNIIYNPSTGKFTLIDLGKVTLVYLGESEARGAFRVHSGSPESVPMALALWQLHRQIPDGGARNAVRIRANMATYKARSEAEID